MKTCNAKILQKSQFSSIFDSFFRYLMKNKVLIIAAFFAAQISNAQTDASPFNVLKFSTSARAVALGGENISVIEDTQTARWSNTAHNKGLSTN